MQKEQFLEILKKYQDGNATAEEVEFLRTYYNLFELEPEVLNRLKPTEKAEIKNRIENRLIEQIADLEPVNKRTGYRWIAAASILFILSIGGYWLFHKTPQVQLAQNDVAPFSKQAILKTGHGKTLRLDSTRKGLLAQYANTNINTTGEAVTYTNSNTAETEAIFDTLQVPAGGKPYHLKLADGSQVVVNVASTLRFPENFRSKNNNIQLLNGEAYFIIRHNAGAPLTIKARDQFIEDIGTEFNVNTYNDEADSRTTLVTGAIKVNAKALIPGQQAIVIGSKLTVSQADIELVTGWVKGDFVFNGEQVPEVMRQLARWYNIEVHYQGNVPKVGFFLKISRSKNISEVLEALERSTNKVHFKIEGRRITVSAKK